MEAHLAATGQPLGTASLDEMEAAWTVIKNQHQG
jgi:hypothetical protein